MRSLRVLFVTVLSSCLFEPLSVRLCRPMWGDGSASPGTCRLNFGLCSSFGLRPSSPKQLHTDAAEQAEVKDRTRRSARSETRSLTARAIAAHWTAKPHHRCRLVLAVLRYLAVTSVSNDTEGPEIAEVARRFDDGLQGSLEINLVTAS